MMWRMVVVFLALVGAYTRGMAATPEEIRAAWDANAAAVRTLQCRCEYRRSWREEKQEPGRMDPFAVGEWSTDEGLKTADWSLVFSVSGEQCACTTVGNEASAELGNLQRREDRATFDGKRSKSLRWGRSVAFGTIKDEKAPSAQLDRNGDLEALWLAFFPFRAPFNSREFSAKDLTVVASEDPKEAARLTVEIRSAKPQYKDMWYRLELDPDRNDRLTRLQIWRQGKVMHDVALTYAKHEKLGWALDKWTSTYFEDHGKTTGRTEGTVVQCTANELLKAGAFDIEFPVGAHVQHGSKYFLQEEGGVKKPLTMEEYWADPPAPKS